MFYPNDQGRQAPEAKACEIPAFVGMVGADGALCGIADLAAKESVWDDV
jgi:hypothetical protein